MKQSSSKTGIRWLREFNWTMFVCACLLVAVGATFIWSASYTTGEEAVLKVARVQKQLTHAAVSVAIFLALLTINYQRIGRYSYAIYGLTIIFLALVLLLGSRIKGSTRWFRVAGAQVQPSELAKVALILVLARYLMYRKNYRSLLGLIPPFLLTAIPIGLILVEPDLGTVLIMIPVLFAMLFAAGARLKHLIPIIVLGLLALPAVYLFCQIQSPGLKRIQRKLLKPHQKARIFAFVNPSADKSGSGYQVINSLIAIGSGGFFGKGLGNGTQNRLRYLPEPHTDFIFSVIGEEWGFCGAIMVLALYAVLFLCGLNIADRTREPFGRLIAVGGVTLLATQVFINVGMTMRMCPITGLTLPFISYGGSSLLSSFVLLSLMINVDMRQPPILAAEDFK
ncbi:MAG: rod shape-determining protein RodA [Planctomycetes bacterium]|nr:rod shape-determining protein RodA [Planctomycetota bacterium]